FVSSDSIGNSGGILCIWEASVFKKEFVTVFDNFVAIYGSWCSNNSKLLIVVVYAPQSSACKRLLWEYISSFITRWNGETIVMGDFNVVRSTDERLGSRFNQSSAKVFNQFIESSGLVDIKLEGYSFTWSHLLEKSGSVNDDLLLKRMDLSRQLFDTKHVDSYDSVQKSKIKWGIEGDENSKYFHGIINKKRSQLAIRGVLVDGDWCIDPGKNMDRLISRDEIKNAVWSCGENKSPGPDDYTFEFFRRYWNFIGPDLCSAVECFFDKGSFPMGNNASFIALIPKVPDAKY
nr:RNA-directed DNA polymerase, eukaryota [Tanacetum cinerariifolium]